MLDCYIDSNLRFLFEIQAIRPETSPFLSVKMAVLSSFFQMFIVLCILNFGFYGTVLNALELAVFFKTEKKVHYRHQTKSGRAWKKYRLPQMYLLSRPSYSSCLLRRPQKCGKIYHTVKKRGKFCQKFVAFLDNMNFSIINNIVWCTFIVTV